MTVVGIDPGFKGAIASYNDGEISILDMPSRSQNGFLGPTKPTIDPKPILQFIKDQNPGLIVLERVHAMPEQGLSSTFRFGEGFGLLQGIISSFPRVRLIMPSPAVWKAQMGVTAEKTSSLSLVRELFPKSPYFGLKKHDGRAEALLLALFGLRSLGLFPRGEINTLL